MERFEQRNLLAGPEFDAVDLLVSLEISNASSTHHQTVLVRLEPVRDGADSTLRLSARQISDVSNLEYAAGDLSDQRGVLLRSPMVDAILADDLFGAAINAEFSSGSRDSITIEVDRGDGDVDYYHYPDATDNQLSPPEVIPTPVMPTLAHLTSIDPIPPGGERDGSVAREPTPETTLTKPPKTTLRFERRDSGNETFERLTDELPGEGEVIRLATTSTWVAAQPDWTDVQLRSDSQYIVTSIQRVSSPTDDTDSGTEDGQPTDPSETWIVDSDARPHDVSATGVSDAGVPEPPLSASVTSLEVALVFEFGAFPDVQTTGFGTLSQWDRPTNQSDSEMTLPLTASSAVVFRPSSTTEISASRFPVRKLAAAPVVLILAGAVWTKLRSRTPDTAVATAPNRKLKLTTLKQR
ncbi:hypothetical protein NZK35_11825 [Stieleria sp. ICT_E10.1]|uniref:hypothetical protein n=1 Tax=Stieleria sedimenti TaxID=2976331 RepID=UPI00217F93AA|nr:hypothetical protein [Stieleria sedimenti]MCS7467333.1 hypothetical protein [Stieleria sedimenti]